MRRPILQKRKGPRKSAIAKASLRKSIVAESPASGHSLASLDVLTDALITRPQVDFHDPLMLYAAMRAKGISLCAFLVTLAAFQRGLKVTFHYERASFDPRFAKAKIQGHRGELYSISNGTRAHTFLRTRGDLSDKVAGSIIEDKHLTKAVLSNSGIRTPKGIVLDKSQKSLVDSFIRQSGAERFVIKPFNGSMGKDVYSDISGADVATYIEKMKSQRVILEEYISGDEYRIFVVGDRVVAVTLKLPPNVVGDGNLTIRALIERKNSIRSRNPRLSTNEIETSRDVQQFISLKSYSFDSIPMKGESVMLLPLGSISRGGDPIDVTERVPEAVKRVALKAFKAFGFCSGGLDIIYADGKVNNEPVVLELNQTAHIGSHSFPVQGVGQGNSVAEAILDYYFPESVRGPMHSTLAYDFAPIREVLESGQVNDVSLPVIGSDWRVLRFSETGSQAKAMDKLFRSAARSAGVFMLSAPNTVGNAIDFCVAYPKSNLQKFLERVPFQFRERLEVLASEAE